MANFMWTLSRDSVNGDTMKLRAPYEGIVGTIVQLSGLESSGLMLLIVPERLCARILRRVYGNDSSRARNNESGAGL